MHTGTIIALSLRDQILLLKRGFLRHLREIFSTCICGGEV